MKVKKTDAGLVVELPENLVEELGLKEGDDVEVRLMGSHQFEIDKRMTKEEAIERLKAISLPLPPGFKFDRQEANER
jgi:antitoxin MazE